MGDDRGTITLPEITIVGDPDSYARTVGDWWCEGYMFGWNHSDEPVQRPMMINDELATAYFEGAAAGQAQARAAMDQYSGPVIGPDPGGEPYDEAEKRWKDAWNEFLGHRENPHLDPAELRFGME